MSDNLTNLETKDGWIQRLAYNPYIVGVAAIAIVALLMWAVFK